MNASRQKRFDNGINLWYYPANVRMRISSYWFPAQRAPGLVEGGEVPLVNTPRSGRLNGDFPIGLDGCARYSAGVLLGTP